MKTIKKDKMNLKNFNKIDDIVGLKITTTKDGVQSIWKLDSGQGLYFKLNENSHQFFWIKVFNERVEAKKHVNDIVIWGLYETDGVGKPIRIIDIAKYKRSEKSHKVAYEMRAKLGISEREVYICAEELKLTPEAIMANNEKCLVSLKRKIEREKKIFSKANKL